VRFEYRWGVGDTDKHRQNARELVSLGPDVILAHGSTIMGPRHRATASIPIVFVSVADPVAGGFVASLSRPGGNTTGFTSFEYAQSGKWIELLKEIAPSVQRVAVLRDPDQVSGSGQIGALQAAAVSLRIDVLPVGRRDLGEIERALQSFAARPDGGLIVTTAAWAQIHRSELIALAAQLRLPAVYPYRLFTSAGGLCCCRDCSGELMAPLGSGDHVELGLLIGAERKRQPASTYTCG
jgi:putative ABC transport system substrate-binding protein